MWLEADTTQMRLSDVFYFKSSASHTYTVLIIRFKVECDIAKDKQY